MALDSTKDDHSGASRGVEVTRRRSALTPALPRVAISPVAAARSERSNVSEAD